MPEATQADDRTGDDQLIEGETATVTMRRPGPLATRDYEVEAGRALRAIVEDAREKARDDGLKVFSATAVNGRYLDQMNGGFHDVQPEDQGPGGDGT